MILKCPRDETVLDLNEWSLISIDLKTSDSIFIWDRCTATDQPPHWVSVRWKGKIPHITTGAIIAVTPRVSHIANRGLSPAPPDPRRATAGSVPPMVIRKR